MLTATNHDGPAFHTRSRTTQHNMTEDLTSTTDTVTPDITNIKDIPDAMPKPLTKDRLPALLQMQGQTHSINVFPSSYQMEKHQNMKLISFYISRDYCINMSWIQTKISWLMSYQKHGNTQCS